MCQKRTSSKCCFDQVRQFVVSSGTLRARNPWAITCDMTTGACMNILIKFFSLRPIWTRRGFEVVWYAYLAATLLHLGHGFSFLFDRSAASIVLGFSFFYST